MKQVLPGIDVLLQDHINLISGQRVGLVTSSSGITSKFISTIDAVHNTSGVNLVALFAPEHGLQAVVDAGTQIENTRDNNTGLPIYSLYGDNHKPESAILQDLDVIIFDIQSVGVRFYTYITTLLYIMQVIGEYDIHLIVCDRPNPITGTIIEGPMLHSSLESFVGPGPLPIRHGLTIGELARLYHRVWRVDCALTVIPCRHWQRSSWFDEINLPWVAPSPGIPKLDSAIVYPGTCLFEGTNLSEGRGTTTPFEVIGAPWLNSREIANDLNTLMIPGVHFRSTEFRPMASKWKDQDCAGVYIHVLDRQVFQPVRTIMHMLAIIQTRHSPDFQWREVHFDRLIGNTQIRKDLEANRSVADIVAEWHGTRQDFMEERADVLIY